jgi:hypothetical protein
VRFRVWSTSSFVILTAAYSIQPYFVRRVRTGTLDNVYRAADARRWLHAAWLEV